MNLNKHTKTYILVYFYTLFIIAFDEAHAQLNHPRISPAATIIQQIGLSEVKVEYSRPGVRGRKIMGDVVPYDRIWRVGANESTKVYFSDSVKINNQWLAPGVYAFYAIPQEKQWSIIFHTNISHWGDGRTNYNVAEDAMRFMITPKTTSYFTETLSIGFDELTHNSALMVLEWEYTRIDFELKFNTRQKMLREIESRIQSHPHADTYYEAARYLQEEDILVEKALAYINKAYQLAGDKYYIHRVWSLLEAKQGNYKAAVQHAEKSKALAAAEGKDEFVRMNEANIKRWILLIDKN